MAGWGGWSKLAIACALVGACQRLEYVEDDDDGDESDDDANAEWNIPPDQEDDDVLIPNPVCVIEEVCECYGAPQQTLCDRIVRQHCTPLLGCDSLEGSALEDCVIEIFCDAGGELEDGILVCNPATTCVGACDADPAACDEDGDGAATFACGQGARACVPGQFCVELGDGCDGVGYECVSPPATCEGGTFDAQRQCVGALACEHGIEAVWGHEIECDECGG
jgi:hypothetical protein